MCAHLCLFLCVGACVSLWNALCVHMCLCVCICLKFWPQLKQVWTKSHIAFFLMSLWSMASSDWSGILRSPGHTPSNNSHLSSWLSAQQAQGKEEERKEEFGWIHFQKLYKAILVCFFLLYIGQCREREQDRFKLFYYLLCNNKSIRIFFLV